MRNTDKAWWKLAGALRLLPVLALVVAVGCDRDGEAAPGGGQAGGAPGRGGPGERIFAVEVEPADIGTIARRVTVSGVVEPIRVVGVNSQIAGAIRSIHVEEGDVVAPGAVLLRLDDRELRAQLSSAEANAEIAASNYERAARLREQQVVTQAEYDRDRANAVAARAQLDQLRTRVEYATVRSPLQGVVTEKLVEAGDAVGNQTRLFTIADVSTMVVRVQVSELDVVELSPGDPVLVALDAFPGQRHDGRIRRVFPSADPSTRLVPVEVELWGEGARLARPGFLARATFALGARENVLLVPAQALVSNGGAAAVFIVVDGIAHRRVVQPGLSSEGRVEIVEGIEPGELVVVAGAGMLREGARVRLVEGVAPIDPTAAPTEVNR